VGGLVFSQTLTLYVTPVFYVYMDRLQQRFGKRRRGGPPAAAARSEEPAPAPREEELPVGAAFRLRQS
jgi:hypothetical protein